MQNIPLAERLRPKEISEVIGQKHLIGKNGALRKHLDQKVIPSIIFWGPPGVGKTTIANLIAKELDRSIYTLSAINSGVKDVREVIRKASSLGLFGKDIPILFIWGQEDKIIPSNLIKNLNKEITIKIIPECGHMAHIEKHQEVNLLIKKSLN